MPFFVVFCRSEADIFSFFIFPFYVPCKIIFMVDKINFNFSVIFEKKKNIYIISCLKYDCGFDLHQEVITFAGSLQNEMSYGL